MGRFDRERGEKISGGAWVKSDGTFGRADIAEIGIGLNDVGRCGTADASGSRFKTDLLQI